jgi:hypothetical protein
MSTTGTTPTVWRWYRVYALAMAASMIVFGGTGLVMLLLGQLPDDALAPILVNVAICFPLLCAYAAGPFLPRRPWAWVYGLVLICAGLPCGCWIIASVPLLIYWFKPETQAFFGRS